MQTDEITIPVVADTRAARLALEDLASRSQSFATAITGAFRDAIVGGKDFESVLSRLALRIAGIALSSALQPVSAAIGGFLDSLLGGIAFAKGGVVGGARPFAEGGVIAAPTYFPLGRGLGLAGEAGAEAILPLSRGSDGRLGVRSAAAPPLTVNFHVIATDAESFRKSEAQVTAMLARAVGRGRRGM